MSLDLARTAVQIDGVVDELREREGERRRRLERAGEAAGSLVVGDQEDKRGRSEATLAWPVPRLLDSPAARYEPPGLPERFSVAATDGSHIDVDRHMPVRCFLINIGTSALTYGPGADARLFSRPRLYASERDLVLEDNAAAPGRQNIEGAVLGAKRTVEEIRALVEALRELPSDLPVVGLMDGSLIMLSMAGQGYPDFVRRKLLEEGFVRALDELREMARSRTLAVASYISLPGSFEVVNALRLVACPYESAECGVPLRKHPPGEQALRRGSPPPARPGPLRLNASAGRALRSLRRLVSRLVASYYGGHEVHFFYVNSGEEIGRVEVPSWVAGDEALLGLTHSLVVDQCRRGPGYPVALMEAHEQAVVTGSERRSFTQLVDEALDSERLPVYTSEKSRSKRLRWI